LALNLIIYKRMSAQHGKPERLFLEMRVVTGINNIKAISLM